MRWLKRSKTCLLTLWKRYRTKNNQSSKAVHTSTGVSGILTSAQMTVLAPWKVKTLKKHSNKGKLARLNSKKSLMYLNRVRLESAYKQKLLMIKIKKTSWRDKLRTFLFRHTLFNKFKSLLIQSNSQLRFLVHLSNQFNSVFLIRQLLNSLKIVSLLTLLQTLTRE